MAEIILGCSGWSYEDWKGHFYDKRITSKLMLPFYSKIFNTVEINSTFYALPRSEKIAENWYNITPKNFVFSIKYPQQITHKTLGKKRLSSELHYMTRFYKLIDPLKEKLAPILIQFPPKFKKDLDLLEELITYLLDRYRYTMEFRNESWITNKQFDSDTLKLLERHDIAYCIVSEPGPIPPIDEISADFVYIRWHGLNKDHWYNYLYSDKQIKEEKERIDKIRNNDDVKKIYGYFNNHLNGQAPANCRHLLKLLGKETKDPESININRLNLPKGQKSIDSYFG